MQWESASPGDPAVCRRHTDCRLKEMAVRRLKAEMNQRVALHTMSGAAPRVFLKGVGVGGWRGPKGGGGGCGGTPPPKGDPELLEAPEALNKFFGLN